MYEIEIADNQSLLRIDRKLVRQAVTSVLTAADVQRSEISVAFVDDQAMHELNRRYLQHDYPTDVLSFVLEQNQEHLDGEIIVSTETAIRQAAEFEEVNVARELLLYVIHGMLHLIGHDDHTDQQRARMRKHEERHLTALGLPMRPNQNGEQSC